MSNKYFQCLIFPIIPIAFTLLWLIFAGYETNISVLLSKPNIRIFPLLLAGISLFYLFLKCKEYTNKYIRILFFLIAILALLFPYIESTIIKNMHSNLCIRYVSSLCIPDKRYASVFPVSNLIFATCIFCFFDCILQMKITGLSEIVFLWVNAYIITK